MLAKNEADKHKYDMTVIATVVDASDSENNKYKVDAHRGACFYAFGNDNVKYAVGDEVRITIPNADYTQNKYIEGYAVDNTGDARAARRYKDFIAGDSNDIAVESIDDDENYLTGFLFTPTNTIFSYYDGEQKFVTPGSEGYKSIWAGYTDLILNITFNALVNSSFDCVITVTFQDLQSSQVSKTFITDDIFQETINVQDYILTSQKTGKVTFNYRPSNIDITGKIIKDISVLIKKDDNIDIISASIDLGYVIDTTEPYYLFSSTPYYYVGTQEAKEEDRTIYAYNINTKEITVKEGENKVTTNEPFNTFDYKGQTITFYNNNITEGKVGKMFIYTVDDGTNGNYSIYNNDGQILTETESFIQRTITISYLNTYDFSDTLKKALIGTTGEEVTLEISSENPTKEYTIKQQGKENSTEKITITFSNTGMLSDFNVGLNDEQDRIIITYTINNIFLPRESEALISLKFDTIDVDAVYRNISLKFGIAGSQPSYVVVTSLRDANDKKVPAITTDGNYSIKIIPYSDNLVPFSVGNYGVEQMGVQTLQYPPTSGIIEVRYPVAWRASEEYTANIISTIIYNDQGINPQYYKGKNTILKNNEEIEVDWTFENNEDGVLSIDNETNIIKPLSTFNKEYTSIILIAKDKNNSNEKIWKQPIYIGKSTYSIITQSPQERPAQITATTQVSEVSVGFIHPEAEGATASGFLIGRMSRSDTTSNSLFYPNNEATQSNYGLYTFGSEGKLTFGVDDVGNVQLGRSDTGANLTIYGAVNASSLSVPLEELKITNASEKGDLYGLYIDNDDKLQTQQIFQNLGSKKLKPEFITSYLKEITEDYTVEGQDNGFLLVVNSDSDITIELPNNLDDTMELEIVQWGTGKATIENTKAIYSTVDTVSIAAQYGVAVCKYFNLANNPGWLTTGEIII